MKRVIELLYELVGIDFEENDTFIEFIYNSEKQHILNDCNLTELPTELEYIVIERAVGRFLQLKLKDILTDDELNVVKSIKEGDTQVEFGDVSNETRIQGVIASLLRSRERDMACYRKFKW